MSASAKPELLIQVVTSPHCPWCLVGHRRLHQVLDSDEFKADVAPYAETRIEVLPYILDPRLPGTSFQPPEDVFSSPSNSPFESPPTKDRYYSRKFPTQEQMQAFATKINEQGKLAGLPSPFVFSGSGKIGASWNADRLVSYAGEVEGRGGPEQHGLQDRVAEALNRAYNLDCRDVSDNAVLADIGTSLGIFTSQDEAKSWLQSDAHEYEVKHKLQMVQNNGVQSVPFYIVNDGADHLSETGDKETFLRMFRMAVANYK